MLAWKKQFCRGKLTTNKLLRNQFEKLLNSHFNLDLERILNQNNQKCHNCLEKNHDSKHLIPPQFGLSKNFPRYDVCIHCSLEFKNLTLFQTIT